MSENEDTLEGKIAAMKAAVSPLHVSLELRHEDNTYTIYVDGSNTYSGLEFWASSWGGFDIFVEALMKKYGIRFLGKYCDGVRGEVYLGTLFDMLSV